MFFTLTGWIPTRYVLHAVFFLLFSIPAYSQFVQSDRFEIPVDRNEAPFEVIPAEKDGLFLFRRVLTPDGDKLQLMKLDTSFSLRWQGFLPVNSRFELMGKRDLNNKLFLLFRHREIVRKDLELVVLENETGNFVRHQIRNYIPFVPSDFQITKMAAIIGGYFNSVPVVIYYSFSTQTSKVLPGLLNESGELTQVKTDSTGGFDLLISARNHQNQKTIWIKSYDREGNLLYQIPLQTEGNKHLIFARSLKTGNDMQVVAGTYSTTRNSEYSKGIFIATIDPNGLQQMRYYNYGDLGNFFKYMKAKREQRVRQRIQLRKIRGKKVRLNYRFIVHEIVPYQNQFVLLGEAFYPKYINTDRGTYYGGFFNPFYLNPGSIRNGRIFDGFRYTHAVVMGFDKNGNLLWDNSFEINDVKTYTLEQFVKLEMHPDKIALLYAFDNQLRSKIIQGNEVLEGKSYYPLRGNASGDIAKNERSSSSKLNYWYDNFFYAFGVQEINNEDLGSRRIFFLSKINYNDNPID
jgi:hypothetical protein